MFFSSELSTLLEGLVADAYWLIAVIYGFLAGGCDKLYIQEENASLRDKHSAELLEISNSHVQMTARLLETSRYTSSGTHTHTHMRRHRQTDTRTDTHTQTHTDTHTRTHIRTHTLTHENTHTHTYTDIYTVIHIHTRTHTHT